MWCKYVSTYVSGHESRGRDTRPGLPGSNTDSISQGVRYTHQYDSYLDVSMSGRYSGNQQVFTANLVSIGNCFGMVTPTTLFSPPPPPCSIDECLGGPAPPPGIIFPSLNLYCQPYPPFFVHFFRAAPIFYPCRRPPSYIGDV